MSADSTTPRYIGRRIVARVIIFALTLGMVAAVASMAFAIRSDKITPFAHVEREPFNDAYDPVALVQTGRPPNSLARDLPEPDPAIHCIRVERDSITLLAGGTEVKEIPGTATTIPQLAAMVDDGDWLTDEGGGSYVARAAITLGPQTQFAVAAPDVDTLYLAHMNSVFLGTRGGELEFEGVTITTRDVGAEPEAYRPFIVASHDATMNATDTTFSALGWDWNSSYGVSWSHGTTGTVQDSVFEESFIGAYTNAAVGVQYLDSVFRNNALYGLDPHTYSTGLVVDGVEAYGNRAHGIIFSDHVTDSVVRNSISHDNGENGIMMDERSTGNLISNNTVYDNTGDGLVTADSPGTRFENNTVRDNRVGVRIDPSDTATTQFTDNLITDNRLASQHALLSASDTVTENGGQWSMSRLSLIWSVYLLIVALFAVASAASVLREERRTAHFRVAT
ncbi:right-handed parallel beta-helix repeat-containing protein [Microbacterium sp.]|uniref:right-handed parallel beta-helix repeat-containing protein n=1 Tax=Microbacterium sp. TaxID=51671 RepID=UPI003A883CD7